MEDKNMEKKKRAAAVAAVTAYIKSQEEMAMAMQAPAQPVEAPAKPVVLPSFWGISGRQDIMQHRNLMQMKAFHGVRFR